MGKNPIETLMGAVVIAVAAIFMLFAYSKADIGPVDGYKVKAKFLRMDGLNSAATSGWAGTKLVPSSMKCSIPTHISSWSR